MKITHSSCLARMIFCCSEYREEDEDDGLQVHICIRSALIRIYYMQIYRNYNCNIWFYCFGLGFSLFQIHYVDCFKDRHANIFPQLENSLNYLFAAWLAESLTRPRSVQGSQTHQSSLKATTMQPGLFLSFQRLSRLEASLSLAKRFILVDTLHDREKR